MLVTHDSFLLVFHFIHNFIPHISFDNTFGERKNKLIDIISREGVINGQATSSYVHATSVKQYFNTLASNL